MRVAIYEPELRVSGPVTWAYHLKAGFDALGHEAHVVTFTKSGKSRKHWGGPDDSRPLGIGWFPLGPDVVAKYADAVEILDGYDFVILTEPKHAAMDKEWKRGEVTIPWYVTFLADTKTPWTTALHGPQYQLERAPFLAENSLTSWPGYIGNGITHGTPEWDFPGTADNLTGGWVYSPLPYAPSRTIDSPRHNTGAVGITGRCTPNKGHQLVAAIADRLPCKDVRIHGAASKGLGPSFTYVMWEMMRDLGWEQTWRDGPKKHTPINPFPWEANKDIRQLRYLGNYAQPTKVCSGLDVHVNLTSKKFSGGLTEFATLEAIDAGCMIVVNENVMPDGHEHWPVDIVPPSCEAILKGKAEDETRMLTTQVKGALAIGRHDRDEIVRYNRSLLRDVNNPRLVAQRFIDLL